MQQLDQVTSTSAPLSVGELWYGPQHEWLFICVTTGNCRGREISVRKVSVRFYGRGRRYLLTKSLSNLILFTQHSSTYRVHSFTLQRSHIQEHQDTCPRGLARIPCVWHKGQGMPTARPPPRVQRSPWLEATKQFWTDHSYPSGGISWSVVTFYLRTLLTSFSINDRPGCCPLPVFPLFSTRVFSWWANRKGKVHPMLQPC